jgi:hypothetical protein
MTMTRKKKNAPYLLCINNDAYPMSLEVRKVYRRVADTAAAAHKFVRVIDESGEDYLYPEDLFVPIDVPSAAKQAFVAV